LKKGGLVLTPIIYLYYLLFIVTSNK